MAPVKIFEILATICVVTGVPLISVPRIEGLYIMTVGQICWTIFGYLKGDIPYFVAQSSFIFLVNIWGIYNWKKKKVG